MSNLFERIIHAIERAIEGPMTQEEVDRSLDQLAANNPRANFKWRTSIVDLLVLLQLPSGMSYRAKLADKCGIGAEFHGSAEDNTKLH